MPTRADIEASTPKCPHRRRADGPQCGRLLAYDHGQDAWQCTVHGYTLSCAELTAVQDLEARGVAL